MLATREQLVKELNTCPEGKKLTEVELEILPEGALELLPSEHPQLPNSRMVTSIAMGGFADIYKAQMKSKSEKGNGRTVVVKVFRDAHLKYKGSPKAKAEYINGLRREYAVWGLLNHKNINLLDGLVIHRDLPSPGLVSEFKKHGDLTEFTRNRGSYDRLHMGRGVACGLGYLHSNGVIHGDLTVLNILVDEETRADGSVTFFPLITDFGKSRLMGEDGFTTKAPNRAMFHLPPELIDHDPAEGDPVTNKVLTFASDVYSFALVLLEIITGKVPYSQENMLPRKIPTAITESALRPTLAKYPVLDPSYEFCWPILEACWKGKKEDRITIQEAHDHLCNPGSEWKASQNAEKN
ncbi:kinase-like protein [Coprinellus micaceus]|uniref:Kinase-like protein n=1 Tax=Coprinellus micaceus TaxID=71717 RepID=A0A4Y7SQ20_COPMI|nr:kinase-like protein [Coprinellus micaceus]